MNKNPVVSSAEDEIIASMVTAIIEKQIKNHKKGDVAQRDVHTKSHGTVKAVFTVRDDIPANLKVGLFAAPAKYDALVRFSNGAFKSDSFDILPNIRGVGVKLLGVPGAKVIPGEENTTEHDFLMANHQVFFAPKIEHMQMLVTGQFKEILKGHRRVLGLMLSSMFKLVKNPLTTSYFSQVPYAFGDRACKYALLPTEKSSFFSIPNGFNRHYLRNAAERLLRKKEVRYTFCVQLQNPGESLDDSSMPWTGKYIPVADLTFLTVNQPMKESDGEELSYNPLRALKEHEPLSWPGRVRKAVYPADFAWRTKQNAK